MFKKKTLFVVGAGSSAEVELPVGSKLMTTIQEKLRPGKNKHGATVLTRDASIERALRKQHGELPPLSNSQIAEVTKFIVGATPTFISIDNLMHTHRNTPGVERCGKVAIAASILEAERACRHLNGQFGGPAWDSLELQRSW